jgi:hypothetical protein
MKQFRPELADRTYEVSIASLYKFVLWPFIGTKF